MTAVGRYFHGFEPGEAELILRKVISTPEASIPAVHALRDAVALPGMPGLYDLEGRRIDVAAARTLSPEAPPIRREKLHKRVPGTIILPERLDTVAERVLFAGHLMTHYGHFIIESMSRLWARSMHLSLPILFTSPAKWRVAPAFPSEVLDSLDVTPRMMLVDKPTIFREVVCPGTAIEYRWKAFAVADEPHRAAAEVVVGAATPRWLRPVYLTRSGLADQLRKSETEPELERELAKRGFEVVRPEELSLREQIELFEQAPLIVGMVGSALHTAMFARRAGTLVTLNWGRGFEHYLLVDGVKKLRSHYVKSMKRHGEGGEYVLDVPLTLQLLEEAGLVGTRTWVQAVG